MNQRLFNENPEVCYSMITQILTSCKVSYLEHKTETVQTAYSIYINKGSDNNLCGVMMVEACHCNFAPTHRIYNRCIPM